MSELTKSKVEMGVSGRNHSIAVSENVENAVIAPKGNDGTVKALADAVEASGEPVKEMRKRDGRIWVKYDEDGSVPSAVDSLLSEWGYEASMEMPTYTTYSK